MRFLSFTSAETTSFGILTADGHGVIDLGRRMGDVRDLGEAE